MIFQQWLRRTFAPRPQARRARCLPRVEALEDRLAPAVITVNSLLDNTTPNDGLTTLREAILSSGPKTGGDSDTIRFAPALDGGTINLTSFINDPALAGPSAFRIDRGDAIVIDGLTGLTRGITIARDAAATPFRLFYVLPTASLTLNGLTLSGGTARGFKGGSSDAGAGGGSAGLGGAVFVRHGTLTILNSTLTGNTAQGGDGGFADNKRLGEMNGGGGAGMGGDGGSVQSVFDQVASGGGPDGGGPGTGSNNHGKAGGFGGGGGGGVETFAGFGRGGGGGFGGGGGGGPSGYDGSRRVGNAGGNGGFGGGGGGGGAPYNGGPNGLGGFGGGNGILRAGGGGAGMGGAVFNEQGTVTITNSTFTGNAAGGGTDGRSDGRGAGSGMGGGLFNYSGTVTVTNSTFSGNTADQGGRGIYNLGYTYGRYTSTAAITLTNTILAEAGAYSSTAVEDFTSTNIGGGTNPTSGSGNLIRKQSGFGGSIVSTADPRLGPLQNNGGRTRTMALPLGSPAVDAGVASGAPGADQRGQRRVGNVDIGAFEFRPAYTMTVNTAADRVAADGVLSLREAIALANGTLPFAALSASEQARVTPVVGLANTITIASGLNGSPITLSAVGDNSAGPSALLIDNAIVTVVGTSGSTLSAAGTTMRLFNVTRTGNLTLRNLTLSGGTALGSSGGSGRGGDGLGGAVYNQGSLTILNSTLTANTARGGPGGSLLGFGGDGGNGRGGAVFNEAGTVTVTNSTFAGNSAFRGVRGTGFLKDGDFGQGQGGGLFNRNGTVTVTNSTFSGNRADQGGRGVFNLGDSASATAIIANTILGQADTFVEDFTGTTAGTGTNATFGNGNLIRRQSGFAGTVVSTADPQLGPLGDYGGPTPTMPLLRQDMTRPQDSPAIDAGRNTATPVAGASYAGPSRSVLGLPPGVYSYRVTAFNAFGETLGSAQAFALVPQDPSSFFGGSVNVSWTAVSGPVSGYKVYGRTPGGERLIAILGPGATSFVDDGSVTPSGALPTADTTTLTTDQRGANRAEGGVALDIGAFESGVQLPQVITFAPLPNTTYGAADLELRATSTSGLPLSFSVFGTAKPTVYQTNGKWYVHAPAAGSYTVTAHQGGNEFISPAPDVAQSFTVARATLSYAATPVSRLYGAANPAVTGTVTGLVPGDTLAAVTGGMPAFATTATVTSGVGRYAINGSGLTVTSGNYVLAQASGNATALTVLAVTSANLQAALVTQSDITLRVQPSEADAVVNAVNGLTRPALPVTITLNLTSGTYRGVNVRPPANVTLVIRGEMNFSVTFVGASPAFTVGGGDVRVEYVTLTNDTHAPTVLVTGGKLTLRHDEIWETPFNDPAVVVTGGSLDMGTADDPGDNGVHGHGNFIWSADPGAVTMFGDRYDVDGLMVAGTVPTTTALSTSSATTAFGQGVRLTARVVPWDGGTPTGNVHFFDVTANADLGRVPLTVVGGVAQAAFTTVQLSIGGHEIRATYEGDGTFIPSEAVVDQTVVVPVRVAGSGPGAAPVVTVSSGGAEDFQLTAFDPAFTGGVNAVVLPLDGRSQIVTGAGPGGGPLVKVFDVASGSLVREFMAFDPDFRGGVAVAAGSLGDDAIYVVAAGPGGGPHVNVYDARDGSLLSSFFAYDTGFTGGVNVSVGDVNGDGRLDVVTGAGPGGSPHVKVFDAATGQLLRSFFAFDPGFMGGVSVAVGDADLDGRADIAAGAGPGGGPAVAVFDGPSGAPRANFFAYDEGVTSGVLVAWTDLDNDGAGVLGVGKAPRGGDPHVFNALTGQNVDELFEDALLDGSGLFVGAVP